MAHTDHLSHLRFNSNQASGTQVGSDQASSAAKPGSSPHPVSRIDSTNSDIRPASPPASHGLAASQMSVAQRSKEVMKVAETEFAKTGSWVVFYREILGKDGVVQSWFPDAAEFEAFQKGPDFAELQEMVAALRSQDGSKGDTTEPERMITIRLPKSVHDALTAESNELNLSINKLCISKLLQRIESRFVPVQQGRRRGRRPGPQGPRKKTTDATQSEN